jgi:hypothetical protein
LTAPRRPTPPPQISIIYALPRLFISSFTLVLPFFPTGTAERVGGGEGGVRGASRGRSAAAALQDARRSRVRHRSPEWAAPSVLTLRPRPRSLPLDPTPPPKVEAEGDVATAFTLARILSNIPPSRGGPTSLVIFDIHALQVRGRGAPRPTRGAALELLIRWHDGVSRQCKVGIPTPAPHGTPTPTAQLHAPP